MQPFSDSQTLVPAVPLPARPGTEFAVFRRRLIIAACLAALLKLCCAATTLGTVDVGTFFRFGRVILHDGMESLYRHEPLYNHMPLVGAFSAFIYHLSGGSPRWFAFFFRLPAIAADMAAVYALLDLLPLHRQAMRWALMLYALSPVSFMISGFHGNVDPVMACCLVFATASCARGRWLQNALFFALACNIKSAALLLAPVFFFLWIGRGRGMRFALAAAVFTLAGWAWPLAVCPGAFAGNVLGYGSYWGIWGITYWLWRTGWEPFHSIRFCDFTPWQAGVAGGLKAAIIGGALALAWRRRNASGLEVFRTVAGVWLVFMVLAPGVAGQYLAWPAAFLLAVMPGWYGVITAASTVFLAVYYTVLSGGFPWYFGIARPATNPVWMLAGNIAWGAYCVCLAAEFRRLFAKPPDKTGEACFP